MSKREALAERVRAVEVEITNLRTSIVSLLDHHGRLETQIDVIEKTCITMTSKIENLSATVSQFTEAIKNLNPRMRGRDKAAIIVALISGIVSIIVVIIQTLS